MADSQGRNFGYQQKKRQLTVDEGTHLWEHRANARRFLGTIAA
jgi:hypothetical protein